MVKGIGRRPEQAERAELGRRPIAAHARTRGAQAPRYGVLRNPVQARRWHDLGGRLLSRDSDARGWAMEASIARCRAGRWCGCGVIGAAVPLSEGLEARPSNRRSGRAST